MKHALHIVVVMGCCCAAATMLHAQATSGPAQDKPSDAPKAAGSAPKQDANPFPEDTSSVPVLPSRNSPGTLAPPPDTTASHFYIPSVDHDPVRSPDEASAGADASDASFSSSQQGLDQMLQPPPDDGKHKKKQQDLAMPHATPKQEIDVGNFYLQTGDWKGALSRFESALVLAPDNPEVYWGLAEAQRHLGDYFAAKANYEKVMEYDPDSRHSKQARKILKQPEMANAASPKQPN